VTSDDALIIDHKLLGHMTCKLRRDILKQGGLALTGLASLTGLTSASSSDNNDDDFSETVTGSGIQDESKLPENLQMDEITARQTTKSYQ
jgi:hypothetical protein